MKDLTLIVEARYDKLSTYRTLRNLQFAKKDLPQKIEIILLLPKDFPDINIIKEKSLSLLGNIRFLEDKKEAIKESDGEYLLFIKGGNYISFNTLHQFFKQHLSQKAIYITEEKIFFGSEYYTEKNISSLEPSFNKFFLFTQNPYGDNPWGETCIIPRKVINQIPIRKINEKYKIGTGLTTFFCECLNKNINVKIIPNTISFYYRDNCSSHLGDFIIPKEENLRKKSSPIRKWEFVENNTREDNRIFLKKFVSSQFPKFYTFLFIQKEKVKNVIRQIKAKEDKRNIFKKSASIIFPKFYLKLFSIKENLKKRKVVNIYPEWLLNEWKLINNIDPSIFPPEDKIYEKRLLLNGNLDKYLEEMLSYFPQNIDFLIFCPWLKIGGADKLVINLIKGLKSLFPDKTIGFMLTENVINENISFLPKDIYFFDFGHSFLDLSGPERTQLLLRFTIQLSPERIININSHSFFNLLLNFSQQISYYSKIYCFCFSPSRTRQGQFTGFAFDFIPKIINHLELVLTDNQNIINMLVEMFALDSNKFKVLYQPVDIKQYEEKKYEDKENWDILWASRIDYEKLPDILEKIIQKSSQKHLNFHIYGNSVIDKQFPIKRFNQYKNTYTYGAYKGGLSCIDYSNYDLFLYTSWFDGMPNTVLEALSLGIPVISSNVGGIKEIIEEGKTGFLVNDIFNEDAYLNKIEYVIQNKEILNNIRKNAFKKLEKQHSWKSYLTQLENIFK